jgi:PAS domain S-box-containing protein
MRCGVSASKIRSQYWIRLCQFSRVLFRRATRLLGSDVGLNLDHSLVVAPVWFFLDWQVIGSVALVLAIAVTVISLVRRTWIRRSRAITTLHKIESTQRAILESLKSRLAVLDPNGQIISANSAWSEFEAARTDECEPSASLGKNYLDFWNRSTARGVPEAEKAYAGIRAVLNKSLDSFVMEYSSVTNFGERLFEMTVTPLKSDENGAVVVHRDITGPKQIEMAIRESESRFRQIADAAPVLIWMSGPDGLCTYFSKKWLEFTGNPIEHELGNGWMQGIHPSDWERVFHSFSADFHAKRPSNIEFRLHRFDNVYRWVLNVAMPRFNGNNEFMGYIGCCVDVDERRSAEQACLEVSGRLITAQEEERARIARELHDDLSQRMAMLEIALDQLKQKLSETAPSTRDQVSNVEEIASEISSDIHHLSHRLHPSKLYNLGLVATLHGLCKELSDQFGLKIHFSYLNIPRTLPNDISLCLYRVSQESLSNVVKHSGAREAKLDLSCDGTDVNLCISDSGVGFDLIAAKEKAGLGLVSMRERLRLVGGQLWVESELSHGTRIHARVPLLRFAIQKGKDSGVRVATPSNF